MYKPELSGRFKKDLAKLEKRGKDIRKVFDAIEILCKGEKLPEHYRDHKLTRSKDFKDCRECHIEPDWLLVYRINKGRVVVECLTTGTHRDTKVSTGTELITL